MLTSLSSSWLIYGGPEAAGVSGNDEVFMSPLITVRIDPSRTLDNPHTLFTLATLLQGLK
jgi:hypothetical protein